MTTPAPASFEEKKPVKIMNRNLAILQSYFSFGPKADQINSIQTFVGHFCALNDESDVPPITKMSEIEQCKY